MNFSNIFLNKRKRYLGYSPKVLLFFSALGFFIYTFLRAGLLSMTHDESGSFYIWTDYDIFSCFIDPNCWRTANLHFIYVLLMKGTVGLFGVSELSIRMPSLIGHLIYLFFSWKLIKLWTNNAWLQFSGFFIINCNPFLLEFFSLGRGYGLANAFMMASIFYMGFYFKTKNKWAAWGVFIYMFLAVFSNFTSLNFYACLVGAMGIVLLILFLKKIKIDWQPWKYLLMVGTIMTAFLFVLIYMPIKTLSSSGEFEYGGMSFWSTFSSIVKASLYGVKYMHANHVETLGGLFILMLIVGLILAAKLFFENIKNSKFQFYLAASLLPALVALATVVQHYLLGVNYLIGRTAVVFVPLTSVALFFFLENIRNYSNGKMRKYLPILISIFCIVHVFRSFQLTHTYEWKYDAQTKDMVKYMNSLIPKGEKVKLGMNWLFHPSTRFYYKYMSCDFTETMVYEKDYRKDAYYDYYYIPLGDEKKINPNYKPLKRFNDSGVLMIRDSL